MIRIKCLNGECAGQERVFCGISLSFHPSQLLGLMVEERINWEINYSEATFEEMTFWFKSELAARIIRALSQGRFVQFMGYRWSMKPGVNLETLIDKIEDHISESGFNVAIDREEAGGLILRTVGREGFNPANN